MTHRYPLSYRRILAKPLRPFVKPLVEEFWPPPRALLILLCLVSASCGPPPEPHATATAGAPHPETSPHRLDIAFCLDSTGSMQGLIDEAKSRIREIDAELRSGDPAPSVRFGVVAYRDRSEDYVTLLYGLDPDIEQVSRALGEIEAEGGGDDPEHVVAGLRRAVRELDWDPEASLRFLFLVGDAPPHLDYGKESDIDSVLAEASEKNIVIGSLVYGDSMSDEGHSFWRQVAGENAKLTEGVAGTGGGFESTLLMAIRREAARQQREDAEELSPEDSVDAAEADPAPLPPPESDPEETP